jgi:hypothetical protein
LSDFQLRSMVERLASSAAAQEAATGRPAVGTRLKLRGYRQEQRDRAAGTAVQEPQADRR